MVSILIPVYNEERYLGKCVSSILCQSYTNFECILVDDGSTDRSGSICDMYEKKDKRIRVIHQCNGGLAVARISGIRAARGDFLAFVDSDDWVENDSFSRLLAPMLEDDSIDVSAGGYVTDTDGRISPGVAFVAEPSTLSPAAYGHRMFSSQGFNWSLWGKVYRRALFADNAMLAKWPHSYGEDTYINYQLLGRIRRAAYVPVQGYHYCMHATSMMRRPYDSSWMAYFEIYDGLLADAVTWDRELAQEIWMVSVRFGLPIRYRLLEEGRFQEDAERIRAFFQKWQTLMDGRWTKGLRWQWAYAGEISWEEYQARKRGWIESLRQASRARGGLYLYGTGAFGKIFADRLGELGIAWAGALESHPKQEIFRGKPVLAPGDIAGRDAAVLVAMNEQHTKEVLPVLKALGITEILQGWQMLFQP